MELVTDLETNKQLRKLVVDAGFDTEHTVTLKLREWLVIAAIWYAYGGKDKYDRAKDAIARGPGLPILPDACMGACSGGLGHKPDCHKERANLEPVILGFIDMVKEDK